MKCVYGPILSRRLGLSLGVDLIPFKTCNWNCVYCQLGRTIPLRNERRDYFPPEDILQELKTALSHQPHPLDWISLVGSGEPLLCASIGWVISQIKVITKVPLAVMTGGSLLYLPQVRKDILSADCVLPSLDAGSPELYRRITRPHGEITFERYIEGLAQFREEYQGRLWLKVMLIKGLNDTEKALSDIAKLLKIIRPDEVHLCLPVRPSAEPWVEAADQEDLRRAVAILGDGARLIPPVRGNFFWQHDESWADTIVGIVSRHPLEEEELMRMLSHLSSDEAQAVLTQMKAGGKVQMVERYGQRFWCGASGCYPEEMNPQITVEVSHDEDKIQRRSH